MTSDEARRDACLACCDCGVPYSSDRFEDLIVPLSVWKRISPTGDEGGLLCPNCILARLTKIGIRDCPAAFLSGPIRTVSPETIEVLRRVENLERWMVRWGDMGCGSAMWEALSSLRQRITGKGE